MQDSPMTEAHKRALVVAYYLSKFDRKGVRALGFTSFNDAFERIGQAFHCSRIIRKFEPAVYSEEGKSCCYMLRHQKASYEYGNFMILIDKKVQSSYSLEIKPHIKDSPSPKLKPYNNPVVVSKPRCP